MKGSLKLVGLCVSVMITLSSCAHAGQNQNTNSVEANGNTAAAALQTLSVQEMFDSSNFVAVGSFTGVGEIVGHGNGVIELGGMTFDDTAYYLEYMYTIEDVLQGDESLVGTTIAVQEYIGMGEEAANTPVPTDLYEDDTEQLIFVEYDAEKGDYYFIPASASRIDVAADGTLDIPAEMQDADTYTSLASISELAK